jgi:hypothetical protein
MAKNMPGETLGGKNEILLLKPIPMTPLSRGMNYSKLLVINYRLMKETLGHEEPTRGQNRGADEKSTQR